MKTANPIKRLNKLLLQWDKKHTKRINADLKRRGMAWLIQEKIDKKVWLKK